MECGHNVARLAGVVGLVRFMWVYAVSNRNSSVSLS